MNTRRSAWDIFGDVLVSLVLPCLAARDGFLNWRKRDPKHH